MQGHIVVFVFLTEVVERAPCTKIAPTKVARHDIHILGLFHHAIVNGDARASREHLLDKRILLVGTHSVSAIHKLVGNFWQELAECRTNRI